MEKALLLYDGECPICQRAIAWVRQHTAPEAVELMPCQAPEREARAPQVAFDQCMTAMQLVLPDGQVLQGERAFPYLLEHSRGYGWLGRMMRWPIISWIAPHVYQLIARNRYAISGLFVKKDYAAGESCSIDKGCR